MSIKTTKYSEEDIFNLSYKYAGADDAFYDILSELVKEFPTDKRVEIIKQWALTVP